MAPETNNTINTWQALKVLAAPGAIFLGLASGLLWFAGDAWVRTIVAEEIQTTGQMAQVQQATIQRHGSVLEQHDEEIEDNEKTIEKVDDKFTEFMREVIDRL
jgi:hypothetical protein